MSTDASNRTCGSCGAGVTASDTICPQCGALLAAYETPLGSEAAAETSATIVTVPIIAAPAVHEATAPNRRRDATDTAPPAAPAEPAGETRGATMEVGPPTKAASISLASSLKKAQPVPARAAPRHRSTPQTAPPSARQTRSSPAPVPRRSFSSKEVASTAASMGKLALGVFMMLVVMGILDVDLIPILVLGVVMVSLLGIMRSAAKASGRKTTTMQDPKRPDRRRR